MSLKDIMSRSVVVADVNDDIVSVSNVMKKYDVGFLPIVCDDRVVGCITDRDLVVKTISNNDYKVDSYVSSVISVSLDCSVDDVLCVMKKNKIKRVIVEDNNLVVGIISISDLFNYASDKALLDTIKSIWQVEAQPKFDVSVSDFYL